MLRQWKVWARRLEATVQASLSGVQMGAVEALHTIAPN